MTFKDLFSGHAANYSTFRPHYPQELFVHLASLCREKKLAWDCATGNGQAAVPLATLFEKVIATDPSEKQLSQAPQVANIEYRTEQAEQPTLEDSSVDLITIAQALHWFRWDEFYPEANRIMKPGALIAAIAYGLPQISPDIDRVILHFHNIILKNYWEQERQLVADLYKDVPFPYQQVQIPQFYYSKRMRVNEFLGYIATWSGVRKFIEVNDKDPVNDLSKELVNVWPEDVGFHEVKWKLAVKVGCKEK